jgi:hypothetical protein
MLENKSSIAKIKSIMSSSISSQYQAEERDQE